MGIRRSEGERGQARKEGRSWGREAGRAVEEHSGREFSQPHQLQPSFEFSEWILVSYARKARGLTHPTGTPGFPHTLPYPHPTRNPSTKGKE